MLIIAIFNWTGIATTKYASSLARSTLQTSKTILVWIFSMMLGWEIFLWEQMIGFFIMAVGTMIYNEVLVIPWAGFKEAVLKHKAEQEKLLEETEGHDDKPEDWIAEEQPALN
jgi:hypothetical protein